MECNAEQNVHIRAEWKQLTKQALQPVTVTFGQ